MVLYLTVTRNSDRHASHEHDVFLFVIFIRDVAVCPWSFFFMVGGAWDVS
jgi:hypothetical protein